MSSIVPERKDNTELLYEQGFNSNTQGLRDTNRVIPTPRTNKYLVDIQEAKISIEVGVLHNFGDVTNGICRRNMA